MLNRTVIFLLLFVFTAFNTASAQTVNANWISNGARIFPLSELKEGMKGKAWTVFRGSRSEEFNVEILGVVPNSIGPKQDMIIGKLSGANAERTFVFAGMSGSPVYIDGRLVGAISYSFPFAKEPICGITPFEQMASVMSEKSGETIATASRRNFTTDELLNGNAKISVDHNVEGRFASGFSTDSRLMAVAGETFVPISTPLYLSGISRSTIEQFAPGLLKNGLMPVAAAGSSSGVSPMKAANENTLLGGDSVVMHLSRGDINIAAAGTVTLREGNKIYAFGHPFFGLGATNMPMSESHVVTVIPNANNSFKLAVADDLVGSMTQDRATGVYGELSKAPKMMPVKVRLTNTRGIVNEINFESIIDELLTPLIINAGVGNAIQSQERTLGDLTIEMAGEIRINGTDPIKLDRRFAGSQASVLAAGAAGAPVGSLLRAGFDGLDIKEMIIDLTVINNAKTAVIERIEIDRSQIKAGQTVMLTALTRSAGGRSIISKIPVTLPADVSPGTITITVADGNTLIQAASGVALAPRTVAEMVETINGLKRPDGIYAVLTRTSTGAIIGARELPSLPPSMLATMNNERSAGGSKATVNSLVLEKEFPASEYIATGSQTLTIEIVK